MLIELVKSLFRCVQVERKTARLMASLNISSPDDAAKFLDEKIPRLEADGDLREMERICYVMRYLLFGAQDNRDIFRKYDAYFRSEDLPQDIKDSYKRAYYEIIIYCPFCIF